MGVVLAWIRVDPGGSGLSRQGGLRSLPVCRPSRQGRSEYGAPRYRDLFANERVDWFVHRFLVFAADGCPHCIRQLQLCGSHTPTVPREENLSAVSVENARTGRVAWSSRDPSERLLGEWVPVGLSKIRPGPDNPDLSSHARLRYLTRET